MSRVVVELAASREHQAADVTIRGWCVGLNWGSDRPSGRWSLTPAQTERTWVVWMPLVRISFRVTRP